MKTNEQPVTIVADNLSLGWAKVMLELVRPGMSRIAPLTLVIRGFTPDGRAAEVPEIRAAVDAFLAAQEKNDTENVAFTIFPQRYWEMSGGDRKAFFDLYIESFQRIQSYNPRNNKRGSYFQRLIDLNGGGEGPNQLEWMIEEFHAFPKSRRSSKFQATTFDPARDHTSSKFLEFPCLQQISFIFEGETLHLNAFYATQQIARKAYGNYLGLARLGAFMASQMGLRFEQLNLYVGAAQMDISKSDPDIEALMRVVKAHADGARTVPLTA
jgi:hypothetical protein